MWSNVCWRGDDDDGKDCVDWGRESVGRWEPQREWWPLMSCGCCVDESDKDVTKLSGFDRHGA